MNTPKNATATDFALSWLSYVRSPIGSAIWKASEWVIGCQINWSYDRPEDLWLAILEISTSDLNDDEISKLAIGPLEALINENYEEFSSRLFETAKRNGAIFEALEILYPPEKFEDDFDERLSNLRSSF